MIVAKKFTAIYCSPCKTLSNNLDKILSENPNIIQIENIDVDDYPELAKQYKIKSLPTLIFTENNIELHREIGSIKLDTLKALIFDITSESLVHQLAKQQDQSTPAVSAHC